ncbi:MAG: hypothetical protein UHS41_00315 [Lachnospiraceae bacterium]|nr:hypothetical protein [Lachnospiraceae bacterium]
MEKLLIFREKVNSFINKRNLILRVFGKFLAATIVIWYLNDLLGYSSFLRQPSIAVASAIICVFIPFSYSYVVFGVLCVLHLINVSMDVTLLFVSAMLLFYIIYNRNFMKYGYLSVLTVVLLPTRLSALVPIFVGVFSGPLGIPPMLMGIIIYFFSTTLDRAILEMTKSADSQQLYQMVLESLMDNKEMILYLLCFVITALVAGRLYRTKINYAWNVAIPVAGVVNALIYLYGSFLMEIESSIAGTIVSCILSIIILEIFQFFRCVIDYSRVENLQFEDDEYYYYVKAVPKMTVSEEDINVKKINVRRKSLIRRREKKE